MRINRGAFYSLLSMSWYCLISLPKSDPAWAFVVGWVSLLSAYFISKDITEWEINRSKKDDPR